MTIAERPMLSTLFKRLAVEEDGQDLIEYAMLALAIAIVVIVGLQALGDGLDASYSNLADQMP